MSSLGPQKRSVFGVTRPVLEEGTPHWGAPPGNIFKIGSGDAIWYILMEYLPVKNTHSYNMTKKDTISFSYKTLYTVMGAVTMVACVLVYRNWEYTLD